jgi:hypothetical protein
MLPFPTIKYKPLRINTIPNIPYKFNGSFRIKNDNKYTNTKVNVVNPYTKLSLANDKA